jgi:hypothetical protein
MTDKGGKTKRFGHLRKTKDLAALFGHLEKIKDLPRRWGLFALIALFEAFFLKRRPKPPQLITP